MQDVRHNSSPVHLDGGRVTRLYVRTGVEASKFPLGGSSSSSGVMERNVSEATTQTVCGLDWSIKDTNWPELGGPGDVCTVCGDKLQDKEFVDETCVQVDHVKDRAKTTHQMCYFCSHDKLRILANNLKRDIRAKDEAIAALEAKLVTMSADAKVVASNEEPKSRSEVQSLVQQVKEKDEMLSQFQMKQKVVHAQED